MYYKVAMVLVIMIAVGLGIYTFFLLREQETNAVKEVNETRQRHRIIANPILIAYIAFPILAAIGAFILYKLK